MKKLFLKKIKNLIKIQYPEYSSEKVEEIMYGVEGIYLTITKSVIIFSIAFVLGILKELLLLLIAFNFIRLFSFGMHASKSWICLIFSSSVFIGGTYLCKLITIPTNVLIISYILIFMIIMKYSPADTVKRPLINKKKRIKYKLLSFLVVLTYLIISLIIKDILIRNSLFMGLVIECILILPITYKIFNLPYKNYKNYGLTAVSSV